MKSNAQTALRQRDPQEISVALARLRRPLSGHSWLDAANAYRVDPVKTLATQPPTTTKVTKPQEVADYVAASMTLHCADGWSYLGRALACLTYGDAVAAIHLGYYASLRGAMALLAAHSIGVFSGRHVVLSRGGKARSINDGSGTHVFAWDALDVWSSSDDAGRRIPPLFRLAGVPADDWVDEFSPGFDLVARSAEWQKKWGLDPGNLRNDHILRNNASYRPSEYASGRDVGVRRSVAFLDTLWHASEPASVPFEALLRHVLRLSLEFVAAETGLTRPKFVAAVNRTVDALAAPAARPGWKSFLVRTTEPADLPILALARSPSSSGGAAEHLEVMARSFVLLTVATLSCGELLGAAGLGRRALSFWWRQLGTQRGLWPQSTTPGRFQDLWEDVRIALDENVAWTARQKSISPSVSVWRGRLAKPLAVLSSSERIALWGLAL